MDCHECGVPLQPGWETCPKCDTPRAAVLVDELHVIDVAHSGEDSDLAERKIDAAVDYCLRERLKGLKVIHGRGSRRGHTSIIRSVAIQVLRRYASRLGGRVVRDRGNDGAHILYFARGR